MNDSRISALVREQPRTNASPAFTHEVMRAVRRGEERRRPAIWRLAAAFAFGLCFVALVNVAWLQHRHAQRTIALRAEQEKLEAELEAVKKIASDAEPRVVLENDRGTRVILDLDSAIQPASLRNYD